MNPYGLLHSAPNSLTLHDHNQLSRMLQIPVVPQQMAVTPSITNSAMRALGTLGQEASHMNGLSSLVNPAHEHVNRMVMNQGGLEQRHRPNSAAAPGTSSGSSGPPGNTQESGGGGNMHRQQNPSSVQDHRLTINQPNLDHRHHKQLNSSSENSRQEHHHPQQQQQQQPNSAAPNSTLDLQPNVMMDNYYEEADDRPHVCQVCNACYKTRTHLKRHMCIHLKARPYSCTFPECGKGFNRKEHANKHYDAVHRLSKFKCTYCSKEISRKDHLNRHIKNMHTFPLPPGGTRRAPGTGTRKKKGEGGGKQGGGHATGLVEPKAELPSRCQQMDPGGILGPPQQHYQQGGFPNGKTSTSSGVSGLLELFTCPECSSSFVSENDLTIHAKTHKPQPYKCSECSRAYTRREKLTEHVRCFHQGQKFSCEYCGKDLSRKDHVLRHVRSVHPEVLASQFVEMAESNGVDPASVISARANNNGSSSHLPTSSASTTSTPSNNSNSNAIPSMGEMGALLKSVCHICLKVFGTSYHLSRHVQSVHNQNMRPYACSFCSKQFKRKDHLTNHTKSHCNSHREGSPSSAQLNMTNIINGAESLRHHALNSLQIEMLTPDDENKGLQQGDLQKGNENGAKNTRTADTKYLKTEKHDARDTCDTMGMNSSAAQVKRGKGGVQERNNDANSRPLAENVRIDSSSHHLPYCEQCHIKFSSEGQLVHHLIQKHGGGGQETLIKDTFQQSLWGRMESVENSGGGTDHQQHPTSSRS